MVDKNRATVILQPRTVATIQGHKAELLKRGIDLNTGQIFKLGLYSLIPTKVSDKDVIKVIEEDGRRTQHADWSANVRPMFQKIGRRLRTVKMRGEKK